MQAKLADLKLEIDHAMATLPDKCVKPPPELLDLSQPAELISIWLISISSLIVLPMMHQVVRSPVKPAAGLTYYGLRTTTRH